MLKFESLQTPANDGDVLIEPCAGCWPGLIEQNQRLSRQQRIALVGTDVAELRGAVRAGLLGLSPDEPVIGAGHQPEFVHPGVWAKHVVVHSVASRRGAAGIDLVVDNDAPRSGGLSVPVLAEGGFAVVRSLAFTEGPAGSAFEGREAVSVDRLGAVESELKASMGRWFDNSLMPAYLRGLAEHTGAVDAVEQHVAARERIDADLGVDLREYRVSRVVGGPFVADLLLDAGRFAQAYNQSLADYRREQGVRGADRPLPALGREGDRIETALWIYQLRQRRRRLWVEREGDRISLFADAERVGVLGVADLERGADAALMELTPWVVRPRALTLTLWARLLACDLFVHGIGGAKYDRITDGIFRRYYRCEPPAYVCASATLRLPLRTFPVTAAVVMAARRRVRDWQFNPDRYCDDLPAEILSERRRLIRRSEDLRLSRGSRDKRREVFVGIRAVNGRLVGSRPGVGLALAAAHALAVRELESNQVAAGREYFYALQPRDRLEKLAGRLAELSER